MVESHQKESKPVLKVFVLSAVTRLFSGTVSPCHVQEAYGKLTIVFLQLLVNFAKITMTREPTRDRVARF